MNKYQKSLVNIAEMIKDTEIGGGDVSFLYSEDYANMNELVEKYGGDDDGFIIKELRVYTVDENGIEHDYIPPEEEEEQFQKDLIEFMENHNGLHITDGEVS